MKAVIFDIDCTILYHTNRSPFDWSDLSGDKPIPEVIELLKCLKNYYAIIFVTGRPESARANTEKWLSDNQIPYTGLAMNDGNPYQKGCAVKINLLLEVQKSYEVLMAFDDDLSCCEMYKENFIIAMMPINYKYKKLIEESIK